MAERPPSCPHVVWEEARAAQESSSPPEPSEVCVVQPLQADASWLAVYEEEQEMVDFIQAFLKSSEKEEMEKMRFLKCICTLCRVARHRGLLQGLGVFCHRLELAESIKVLLEEEPRDHLRTAVRQLAMDAIAALSSVETVLEGQKKSLLHACFTSVFSLPSEEDMQGLDASLYFQTLDAMDSMLRVLVFSSPASSLSEDLQTILKMLLTFTGSKSAAVRSRVLRRIQRLSHFLARCFSLEVRSQAASSQDISPSLCPAAACSSGFLPGIGALSKALPCSEGLGPGGSSPQSPPCQEPELHPALCGTGLPQGHGGSCLALAALRAGASRALQSSEPPEIQPWARSWVQGFGPKCLASALVLFCLPPAGLARGVEPWLLQRDPDPHPGTAAGASHPSQLLQGRREQPRGFGCSLFILQAHLSARK
ncbi:uncharacterized protein LJ206_002324 isoform 2-T2 [Theristicus caerulescens]